MPACMYTSCRFTSYIHTYIYICWEYKCSLHQHHNLLDLRNDIQISDRLHTEETRLTSLCLLVEERDIMSILRLRLNVAMSYYKIQVGRGWLFNFRKADTPI